MAVVVGETRISQRISEKLGTDRELLTETPPRLMFSIWPRMIFPRVLPDARPRNHMALQNLREHRLPGLSDFPIFEPSGSLGPLPPLLWHELDPIPRASRDQHSL